MDVVPFAQDLINNSKVLYVSKCWRRNGITKQFRIFSRQKEVLYVDVVDVAGGFTKIFNSRKNKMIGLKVDFVELKKKEMRLTYQRR
jgi:hypothetical protein